MDRAAGCRSNSHRADHCPVGTELVEVARTRVARAAALGVGPRVGPDGDHPGEGGPGGEDGDPTGRSAGGRARDEGGAGEGGGRHHCRDGPVVTPAPSTARRPRPTTRRLAAHVLPHRSVRSPPRQREATAGTMRVNSTPWSMVPLLTLRGLWGIHTTGVGSPPTAVCDVTSASP